MHIFNGIGEKTIRKAIRVNGTGSLIANVLQLTGSCVVTNQYAIIKSVTTLTNATAVYASIYDGTVAEELTDPTGVLSGAPVGTLFLKDKVKTEPYSIMFADQGRANEITDAKKAGLPFTVTQKNGVDTFLRLHLTTTDNPVDFTAEVTFMYEELGSGSSLVFL
jgi:hypothetical protein